MMPVLTAEEAEGRRRRQVVNVANAIRSTLRLYPGTKPEALTAVLAICGTDFGLLSDLDFAEARSRAASPQPEFTP